MKKRNIIIIAVVVVVVAAAAGLLAALLGGSVASTSQSSTEDAASSTVASFGQTLQQVSILAPNASSAIASTYAPYVDPTLLAQWEANPSSAPGRVVSSPWPDHIQIDSVTSQGAGYIVDGILVFMSSTGEEGTTPITAQLEEENGTWMIVAFQGQQSSS